MPFSPFDDNHPEALWNWMDTQRKAGNDILAFSQNANLSDGWMYRTDVDSYGSPIDAAPGWFGATGTSIWSNTVNNNGNKNQEMVQKAVRKMFKQWPKQ